VARPTAHIIIVGAGVAGTTTAAILAQQGWRVLLLDSRSKCPPVFKAEKVERDELSLLRKYALLEPLLPYAAQITKAYAAFDGRIFKRLHIEQIGIAYDDLVNTLRANLPASVETKLGRVNQICPGPSVASVHLADGEELKARLVVLACGISSQLLSSLGLRRRVLQKEQCIGIGFDVVAANSPTFESVTYYPKDSASRIDYLTLFKIRNRMRANLFVFRPGNDPWIRAFHHEPQLLLGRALPGLPRVIGDYEVTGKVVSGRVDLYRTEGEIPDGVVLIGDALQNACPSTGLGFRKVFTDIDVLAQCVPEWFSTPGMTADKLKLFYDHPRKRSVDAHALQRAFHNRHTATDPSLRWQLTRSVFHLRRHLAPTIHLSPHLQPTDSRLRLVPGLKKS
jgi:2-polyprenyl-6-methoxyphenol hydroxylase-like FAD-dependent oxidoreductase